MKLQEGRDNPILWLNEKNMTCCHAPVKFKFDRKSMEFKGICQNCHAKWTLAISTFQIIREDYNI